MQENPYLQNVHIKSNNQINYLGGGINTSYPSQYIQDDECEDMYNLCLDEYPAIQTKEGRHFDVTSYNGEVGVKIAIGNGKIQWFGNIAGRFYYIEDGILKDSKGTSIDTIQTSGNIIINFNYIYYKDSNNQEYIVSYGSSVKPKRYRVPLSANNVEEISLPDRIDGFSHMCYHKDRFIGTKNSKLYFSALQNPMDWSTEEQTRIDTLSFTPSGLVSFDDKLVIFSSNNTYLYYGSNILSGQADSYTCISLNNGIGCCNAKSIVICNGLLYWRELRRIFEYDGSSIRRIDEPTGNNRN